MAAKVGVLDLHQKLTESPVTYVKRSVADLLVRRLLAERVRHGVIRLLAVNGQPHVTSNYYIPEKLPPAEVPGVRFIPPIRPEWTKLYSPSF